MSWQHDVIRYIIARYNRDVSYLHATTLVVHGTLRKRNGSCGGDNFCPVCYAVYHAKVSPCAFFHIDNVYRNRHVRVFCEVDR